VGGAQHQCFLNFDATRGFPGEGPPKKTTSTTTCPNKMPAAKQGPLAWELFHEAPSGFRTTGVNRLVAHAVQDDTMLYKYLPRAKEFITWSLKRGASFHKTEEIDSELADYLEDACYSRHKGFDFGSMTFFGFLAVFPEFKMQLPRAYRAYHAWKTMHVGGEGQGIPEEAVFVIAEHMRNKKLHDMALLFESSMDLYLRQGEWRQLKAEDIFIDTDGKVAFVLGVAERGERVKTGHNQGVVLDSVELSKEWREKINSLAPGAPIFNFSQAEFSAEYAKTKAELNLGHLGPLHDLRHAGAARDAESGTRDLEQIRRRGRWKAMDSVQRYTKTYLLVKARSLLPAAVLQRGRELLARRGKRQGQT
jgi:predicted MarR family transcription regulator